MSARISILLSLILMLLSLLGGCARWGKEHQVAGLKFPTGRMTPDSVAFEIGIAQLDNSQAETFENYWALLDQQKIPLADRRRMDQNGLRAAVMASQTPAILNRLIEPRPVALEELDVVERQLAAKNRMQPKPRMIVHQRITSHDGETYPIQTSEVHPQLDWMVRNGQLQTPGTGELVRGIFEIMTLPQGDGTVRMRIMPQIHHGQLRPTIGVAERDFVFDSSQLIKRVSELTLDVVLRPGETIVIAPTSDVEDLGRLFFGGPHARSELPTSNLTHRVLLIRVVQTQMDDLFGNSVSHKRLTSTLRQ